MQPLPKIQDFSDDFDPFTALMTVGGEGHITNHLQDLATLGERTDVFEGDLHSYFGAPRQLTLGTETKAYMVLSYKACSEVLMNGVDYSNAIYNRTVGITFGRSITTMDMPEHPRYRRLFQAAFTPKMLGSLQGRFQDRINALIDTFASKGRTDLVEEFARHFPFQFICDLLALPIEDRATFHKIAAAQACVGFDPQHGQEASSILGEYLEALIAQRRVEGGDGDLVHALAKAEVDGERLPDDVLLGFFRQLMNAGGDTSYHGFSNILAALFSSPEQLEAVRKDRNLITRVIEEGLRWGAPITAIDRITTRDVEICGTSIPAGSCLRVCIAAANRDSRIWSNPHHFDIFRESKRHIAFGNGAHVCIGQHLARMELQVALNILLNRLPNVQLDKDESAPTIRGLTFRGADAVHVRWG